MDDVRNNHKAPGDSLFNDDSEPAPKQAQDSHLDSEESRAEFRKLLSWLQEERDLQAENRLEMAIDEDMYDGFQWRPEDAAEVEDRGQMPLVFNELAPMIDWLIGTERRSRVDSKVLPRNEDDVAMADIKTKVMKFLSDVNRAPYVRSAAFSEAVKAGLSWIEDGVRDDPTKEAIFKTKESWRNVLHDSRGAREGIGGTESMRYIFRWRMVDLDVAKAAWPRRAALLEAAAQAAEMLDADMEGLNGWGTPLSNYLQNAETSTARRLGAGSIVGASDGITSVRRQVKVYECQYRKPANVSIVDDGPFRGAVVTPFDPSLSAMASASPTSIVDKVMMRVHMAVFLENGLLELGPSPFRHNDFSLSPMWCYRRSRDGLPYGMSRRVRDIQLDLNKRGSKANFLINSNQIIADDDATDDWDTMRDEANRPDGLIVKKRGSDVTIRRDSDQVAGQVEMMRLNAESIQKSGGVNNENMGRQTNAVSGEAIKARQLQGSVVTTEPFDNLRLCNQMSGSKELSLLEQFMTEEKVIRVVGERGGIDWLKVNQLEVQPDGSVRVLDDITASIADYVVSEQDYSGTLRQVMFDSLNALAMKLNPEVGMRLMRMAFEYSDLPNKDAIAQELRGITGEPDPDKELTPEEQQQQLKQQQQQAEAMELQRQDAVESLNEKRAKVREINAKAAQLEQQVQQGGAGGQDQEATLRALMYARAQAQDTIESLSEKLAKATSDLASARSKADNNIEAAHISANAEITKAEAGRVADAKLQAINARLDAIEQSIQGQPAADASAPVTQPQEPPPTAPTKEIA